MIYLAIGCFDVDGGSSSSHGHTDTETVAFSLISSSHGHTASVEPVANVVSKFSGINLVASLYVCVCQTIIITKTEKKKDQKKIYRKNKLMFQTMDSKFDK